MTLRQAYQEGKDIGYDIANENIHDFTRENGTVRKAALLEACVEVESDHYRQFSPFEFLAAEMNDSRDPERTWERYEAGVLAGIRKAIREN